MPSWLRPALIAVSLIPLSVWANPFASLSLIPYGEAKLAGKTIFTLENGDYILPSFSPDSHYLAFSRELAEGATELAEIQALDLKTLRVKTLLDAKSSREFAVYKSFVADFTWKNATTLKASISDGDVNGVNLFFDVALGKLIEKKPLGANDDGASAAKPSNETLAAFPSIPRPALENALQNGFKVGNDKYVVQKNYWKQDNDIWLLDVKTKQITKLIVLPEEWIYSLRGAFAAGNAFIMLVAFNKEAYLARQQAGRLELLYRLPVSNYQQTALRVEHANNDRVLFQISTGAAYEKRENYFFVYDKAGLKKIKDITGIYDLNVDASGHLVCFSLWKENKRKLVIQELKDPR
ncbi:MAG: hypothetical protein HY081_11300 [Gammaproteobacteria bacterium]|nr:hypothetical protein [Gammaproteobacteria bacterium]